MGIRQLNPSKVSGVIEISRKFSFWGEEGFRAKNVWSVFSGPNGNCLQILKSISPKKWTDRHMHKHSIALRDRIDLEIILRGRSKDGSIHFTQVIIIIGCRSDCLIS